MNNRLNLGITSPFFPLPYISNERIEAVNDGDPVDLDLVDAQRGLKCSTYNTYACHDP